MLQDLLGRLIHVLRLHADLVLSLNDYNRLADLIKHFVDALFIVLVQATADKHCLLGTKAHVIHDNQNRLKVDVPQEDETVFVTYLGRVKILEPRIVVH